MSRAVKKTRKYQSVRRAEQAEETRRRILEAARKVLVEHGYAKTTMLQIAAEAGTSVETIYAVFGTKAELLASAVRAVLVVDGKAPHRTESAEQVRQEPDPREHLRR